MRETEVKDDCRIHLKSERTGIDHLIYEAEIESDVEIKYTDTKGEGGGGKN